MRRFLLLAVGVASLWADATIALPSDLDPSFGSQGMQIIGDASSSAKQVRMRSDGRIVASLTRNGADIFSIVQLNADGTPDGIFGTAGSVSSEQICAALPHTGCSVRAMEVQTDGKIVLAIVLYNPARYGVVRLLSNGALDSTFGNGGASAMPLSDDSMYDYPSDVGVLPDGRIIVGGVSSPALVRAIYLTAARFLGNGALDAGFGSGGRLIVATPVEGGGRFLAQADGKLVWLGGDRVVSGVVAGPILVRTSPDGELDSSFGVGGVVRSASSMEMAARDIALQPDGGFTIAGYTADGAARVRLLRLSGNGTIDTAFGAGGIVDLPISRGRTLEPLALRLDSEQRVIVAGTSADPLHSIANQLPFLQIVVARLTRDGKPDDTFAAHGSIAFSAGLSSSSYAVAVLPEDVIVVGGTAELAPFGPVINGMFQRRPQAALFRLKGGNSAVAQTVSRGTAVEFYHQAFDHYFISANPFEIAILGQSADWTRTGETFNVWSEDGIGLSPTCRFFSDQSFAPLSSHFYTPYSTECAQLRTGAIWKYEGDAFWLRLPAGSSGQGTCAAGSVPLYRAYNNGQGGAPNHRYTQWSATLDKMVGLGWTFEGEAQTRIFACIPDDDTRANPKLAPPLSEFAVARQGPAVD